IVQRFNHLITYPENLRRYGCSRPHHIILHSIQNSPAQARMSGGSKFGRHVLRHSQIVFRPAILDDAVDDGGGAEFNVSYKHLIGSVQVLESSYTAETHIDNPSLKKP